MIELFGVGSIDSCHLSDIRRLRGQEEFSQANAIHSKSLIKLYDMVAKGTAEKTNPQLGNCGL